MTSRTVGGAAEERGEDGDGDSLLLLVGEPLPDCTDWTSELSEVALSELDCDADTSTVSDGWFMGRFASSDSFSSIGLSLYVKCTRPTRILLNVFRI